MGLRIVTECKWAREDRQANLAELDGLAMGLLKLMNTLEEEFGDDEEEVFKGRNYGIVDEYVIYVDGKLHVLDGGEDVIAIYPNEFEVLYVSEGYVCGNGHRILVAYPSLEDAGEMENEVLISLD